MGEISFLITTVNLSIEEIKKKVISSNLFGEVLVGNQGTAQDGTFSVELQDLKLTIFNQMARGVSKNRNLLLRKASSKYVTFMDDDCTLEEKMRDKLTTILSGDNYRDLISFRFNCRSLNSYRPIRTLKNKNKINFRRVKSFGVWGIIFNREWLVKNRLLFDETIGPGCYINHGEDTIFLFNYFKSKGKMVQHKETLMTIGQTESTWIDNDFERYFISHGYCYQKIYRKFALFIAFLYCVKHRNIFDKYTLTDKISCIRKGIYLAKHSNK